MGRDSLTFCNQLMVQSRATLSLCMTSVVIFITLTFNPMLSNNQLTQDTWLLWHPSFLGCISKFFPHNWLVPQKACQKYIIKIGKPCDISPQACNIFIFLWWVKSPSFTFILYQVFGELLSHQLMGVLISDVDVMTNICPQFWSFHQETDVVSVNLHTEK